MGFETRLVLIDGTAVLYRAFYAIRDLCTRDGRPTNALFGFVRMVREVCALRAPTHAAVVFDGGTPAERLAVLDSYKAQRPPMPDALRAQLPLANDYLDRAGLARVRIEGQEADDVMASLAAQSAGRAGEVVLATSDKDMFQLVSERVRIAPVSGGGALLGPEDVRRKLGVAPEQVPDWLALTGDSVDNIPGVPGVGPKTAASLLAAYGSLAGIRAHLDDIAGERLRTVLRERWATVERNAALVRLRADMDCGCDWESLKVRPPDVPRLLAFFRDVEFGSLASQLQQGALL